MLAYVFWHQPYANCDSRTYVADLLDFHRSINAHKPAGFDHSAVFRLREADWLAPGEAFEDWYLVADSAALDVLNDAAISLAHREAHDRVAHQAAAGTAGLYRLRRGAEAIADARRASWLTKAAGLSYEEFFQSLEPWTKGSGVGLWGRQMTLGPTREFCLLSHEDIDLPESFSPLRLRLQPIWPSR